MPRRRAILIALLLAVPLLPACDQGLPEHVLDRVGYGGDPWSRWRVGVLGVDGYLEEQLHPETLDDSAIEAEIASLYPLTTWPMTQVRLTYTEYNTDQRFMPGRVRHEMMWARMLRDVFSKRQLEQVLVDFWYNHFNVDARFEIARWGVVTYEREALRPHVLGRFRDMLGAVAAHPAMLDYLDNAQNFIPGYIRGTTRFGPNENYARELLELHTVGVDAGYTLGDVQEVARAFTGWTINEYFPNGAPNLLQDRFVYEDAGHDKGSKSIMGSLFIPAGGGQEDGELVLDFLARHPSTAHFVASKLVQRFVADDPPQALVDRVAATFLATDGDLREVTRTVLFSPEFRDVRYWRQKVKRPQHFAASLARAVGVTDRHAWASWVAFEVGKMGEDLYAAAPPTGYPERSSAWLGEGPFVHRLNLALWASYGEYGFGPLVSSAGASNPRTLILDMMLRFVPSGLGPYTWMPLMDFLGVVPQWTRAPEAASVVLAGPEFQVH